MRMPLLHLVEDEPIALVTQGWEVTDMMDREMEEYNPLPQLSVQLLSCTEEVEQSDDVTCSKKNTCTMIESIMNATQLVLEAAIITPHVPKMTDSFASITKDPNARKTLSFLPCVGCF